MKKNSTLFLKLVLFLIGVIVLAFCMLVLPTGIISDNVGYYRPLLIGMYLPAVPFFIALFQAIRLLSLIEKNGAFSQEAVETLKRIKRCGTAISILYILGMPYIYYVAERDDAPGVILIGASIVFASAVVATAAAVFQKILQHAIAIQSENDLTV